MGAPFVEFRLDVSKLNSAITKLYENSSKAASDIVNRKAYWIVTRAQWKTPRVPSTQIAAELQATKVIETHYNKDGSVSKSRSKAKAVFNAGSKEAPILSLILQSRVKGSGRNRGYAAKSPWPEEKQIPQSPWKGVNRATGAARMLEAMRKMYGMKLRSRAYLASGWIEAIATLQAAMRKALLPQFTEKAPAKGKQGTARYGKPKGEAKPAQPGMNPKAMFVNAAWSKEDGGEALLRIGGKALQEAVNEEARDTMDKAIELEFKNAATLSGVAAKLI